MGKEEELLKIVHNNDEKKLQVNSDPEVGGPDYSVNRLLIVCNELISVYVKLIFFQFFLNCVSNVNMKNLFWILFGILNN